MVERRRQFGGKGGAGVWQTILGVMPPHQEYIETHLGGGAIMRHKAPAERSIGIDRDRAALEAFEATAPYPVELVHGDAHAWLRARRWSGAELVYLDPPYLLNTRSSRNRFRYDYSDADHVDLLGLVQDIHAKVIISGYPSALYDEALGEWGTLQFQAMSRGGTVRTEQIWFNFEPGLRHWVHHAGKDYTDRQRIKRKAGRWRANYAAMPPVERQAVLAEVLAAEAEATGRELQRTAHRVAVLCAGHDSYYTRLHGVDVYDRERDARSFEGGCPVVAHPPCRAWSKTLGHQAKPARGELALGLRCAEWLKASGGVLEHPAGSGLFRAADLPHPDDGPRTDGLFTIQVPQFFWGYPIRKETWLCFAGVDRAAVQVPYKLLPSNLGSGEVFKRMTPRQRAATVPALAHWLVSLARTANIERHT